MKRTSYFLPRLLFVIFFLQAPLSGFAQDNETTPVVADAPETEATPPEVQKSIELNGDTVEYDRKEGKFLASGNVVLHQNGATLFCDQLEFYRDRQQAYATGHVMLTSNGGSVWAESGEYNFETKKGEFKNARLLATPVFGRGEVISRVRENYFVMTNGYLTTSDYDDPEWRVKAKRLEVFVGDRAIAYRPKVYFGGVPVMSLPKYVQYLNEDRPMIRVVPGYSKDFGTFLLTSLRTRPFNRVDTTWHLDYREKRDLAWGVDVEYSPPVMGRGLVKTYYMNERTLGVDHIWEPRTSPTTERERYQTEWRHQWSIDPETSFIGQYFRVSDANFRKEYFEQEYRKDESPQTYFLVTRTLPHGTASVRGDFRVNPFQTMVERVPEVAYTMNSQQIGDTRFYVKSTDSAVKLVNKNAKPSSAHNDTVRLNTSNELSRPFKLAFLEFRPYVGAEHTYYSKANVSGERDMVRGVFWAGNDISTKFYRVYDVHFDKWGIEVNRLRHVLTPTLSYLYRHRPTMPSSKLFQYDAVDSRTNADVITPSLESKFQTKRDGKSVDLWRTLLSTNYLLKPDPGRTGWGDIRLDNELYPNQYVTFHSDVTYSNAARHVQTANFDLYLNSQRNWSLDLSRRYTYREDDLFTAQLTCVINPKWRTVIYNRWDVTKGDWEEQRYSLVRDLHSWELEVGFNDKKNYSNSGSEFWIIFRLKAFPDTTFGGGTGFHARKPGSQTGI